ncbi:type I polyketide synthase [Pendulispora albinea]|uniref:Type I polyketide synthase n=2 Tax=Pendulispora albinea TaxID=2741071 RepID=A0ABZ2MCW9_9BACT
MGRELYAAFPVYRRSLDGICACFDGSLGVSLREVIFEDGNASRLEQTQYAQAALFAVEVSVVRLLESWGIRADVVMGHSVGELGAAHVAGVLSLEDACRLVAARGRLMQGVSAKGAMASLQATEAEVVERLRGRAGVSIAAVNGPRATVISGDEAAVQEVMAEFEGAGRKAKRLEVSHAFHSSHMDEVLEAFGREAAKIDYRAPQTAVISNVTGKRASDDELRSAGYWMRHVREPVRFGEGVQALEAEGVTRYVEVGPRGVLSALAAENLTERGAEESVLLAALRADRSEVETVLEVMCNLHVIGQSVDWGAFFEPLGARRMALPTYAFQHERYWLDAPKAATGDMASVGLAAAEHPFLGAEVALAEGDGLVLTGALSLESQSWLREHDVFGTVILPGTAFLELAFAAGERVGLERVEELVLEAPLGIREKARVQMQVMIGSRDEPGSRPLSIYARESGAEGEVGWIRHASGRLGPAAPPTTQEQEIWEHAAWPPAGARAIPLDELYERLSNAGLVYGPSFQGLHAAWKRGEDLFVEVQLPERMAEEAGQYHLHPALLDSVLHALALNIEETRDDDGRSRGTPGKGVVAAWEPALPFSWTGATLPLASSSRLRAQLSRKPDGGIAMTLGDASGRRVAQVQALLTRPVSRDRWQPTSASSHPSLYSITWSPLAQPAAPATGTNPWAWLEMSDDGAWSELQSRIERAGDVPDTVVLSFPPPHLPLEGADLVRATHAATERGLSFLRAWLADERFASSTLLLVTYRAIAAAPDEGVLDLVHAPLWGLVRTAQTEHPSRTMAMVDIDDESAARRVLPGALLTGELQLAWRRGTLRVPRLTPLSGASTLPALPHEGTFLVTGATGALGARFARHLVEKHGIRHLLLVSRRGGSSPGAAGLVRDLEAAGARVTLAACDTADREALAGLIAAIAPEHPLRGVVHAAGVLEDGILEAQTPARFARVFAPKVDAALHLHELTRTNELSLFVLFSSLAGVLGSPGQSNYASANTFLDALASQRRAAGLPAVSLAWGPWAEDGMAARSAEDARSRRRGVPPLSSHEGTALFDAALEREPPLLIPARFDIRELRKGRAALPPLLQRIVPTTRRQLAKERESGPALLRQRLTGLPATEVQPIVLELVQGEVAAVLGHASPATIEATRPLHELGLDSLMALDLRNRLVAASGLRFPATLLFDHPTPLALARLIQRELSPPAPDEPPILSLLERLEALVSSMESDDLARPEIAARLRVLSSRLSASNDAQVARRAVAQKLQTASDDELFAFYRQVGKARESGS